MTLGTVTQVVDVRLCLYQTGKKSEILLMCICDSFPSTHACVETVGRL